ncbi:MAG: hypothetical protein QNJ91_08340, partial [Gammaproteobacteria bacterium]|nr:hypothetical protein [Gammaproteobacteria bacterium]
LSVQYVLGIWRTDLTGTPAFYVSLGVTTASLSRRLAALAGYHRARHVPTTTTTHNDNHHLDEVSQCRVQLLSGAG